MKDRIVVIYHGNCADGFGAALAARKKFGDAAEYIAGVYQDPPPDVTGARVVLVDFSYKRAVMAELASKAKSVLVLDHHKSAAEDLTVGRSIEGDNSSPWIFRMDQTYEGNITWDRHICDSMMDRNEGCPTSNIYCLFDMGRSGAGIAWDFFHPDVPRPALVNHIEDRDLWRFSLPFTREIQAAVFSYPYEFDVWDGLLRTDTLQLALQGEAIERKHHKDIAELVKVCQRPMTIAGHVVPVASLPYTLTSDAGHLMAHGNPFAACYWDTADGRVFSLRSQDDGADVSEIAKQYGGGGHAHAAGFRVPRDHALAVA
jgi:oligoribonuclease NrnB/cAMP/cGMP phosphodiesterase (DHH superfamily)